METEQISRIFRLKFRKTIAKLPVLELPWGLNLCAVMETLFTKEKIGHLPGSTTFKLSSRFGLAETITMQPLNQMQTHVAKKNWTSFLKHSHLSVPISSVQMDRN